MEAKRQRQWDKEKSGRVTGKYSKEFVEEFKAACNTLGIKQSQVFRKAMEEIIQQAIDTKGG